MPEFKFKCPYCFRELLDSDVHFRSERVNGTADDIIPDDFDDIETFRMEYTGDDKEVILKKYEEMSLFMDKDDPVYNGFWSKYGMPSEHNPADKALNGLSYRRPVIDPSDDKWKKWLKPQSDGNYLVRDNDGMVSYVELVSGEKCKSRVCCHCHNPLPADYGKHEVKFVTVIGITGAGKTVYISQLLRKMPDFCANVGMAAIPNNVGVKNFLEANRIMQGKALPGPTPEEILQQPLFYQMVLPYGKEGRVTKTFVLYDVAGECFKDPGLIDKYAPYVAEADGVIVLLDPMQFSAIVSTSPEGMQLDPPTTALQAIYNKMAGGNSQKKCDIPFAVCISKADSKEVQSAMNTELINIVTSGVRPLVDSHGDKIPAFNARDYTVLEKELKKFIETNEPSLTVLLKNSYTNFDYFAFSALGCPIGKGIDENGVEYSYPDGQVIPCRIEEPLFWLLGKLGYIDDNCCPKCGSADWSELTGDEQYIPDLDVPKKLFSLKPKKIIVNRKCNKCPYKWYHTL